MNNNNNKRRHHHNNNGKNRNRQRFQAERPSINKVYDSNGPTGRQRGTASTLYEKYITLARDANSSGDRVLSENLMQHAEHYLRIVNSIQEQMQMSYRETYQENSQTSCEEAETEIRTEIRTDNINLSSISIDNIDSEEQASVSSSSAIQKGYTSHNSTSEAVKTNSEDAPSSGQADKPILRRRTFPFARRRAFEQNPKDTSVSSSIDNEHNILKSDNFNTDAPLSQTISNQKTSDISENEVSVTSRRRILRPRSPASRRKTTENNENND